MRKLIVVAAIVLASATAEAGQPTLASADEPAERPAAVETTQTAAPTTAAQQPKADAAKPSVKQTARADKPRYRRREWTESRIIGELHRHGIYW